MGEWPGGAVCGYEKKLFECMGTVVGVLWDSNSFWGAVCGGLIVRRGGLLCLGFLLVFGFARLCFVIVGLLFVFGLCRFIGVW